MPNLILVIGYVWPEPHSSAAGGRMLGLLRLFRQRAWSVVFASPAADSAFSVDLASLGIEKKSIALNSSSFDAYIKEIRPQVVLFDRFLMEEQFGWRVAEQCPEALRILDTVDLHFLRHARQSAVKEGRGLVQKDLHSEMAKREIASLLRSDLSLIISEYEMTLLIDGFKIDPSLLYYLPLLVPPIDDARIQNWPRFEDRKDFVFIGNFLHEPNWDAVQHLNLSVWPLIRERIPQAQLWVYGAYPTPKAMRLHQPKEGFHVPGRADDAQATLSQARICLAPLRFGAGVKGKLIEAMQCGTPSVTTEIGAEGLKGDLPWSGTIADTAEAIAEAAALGYDDKEKWLAAQKNGVALVNARNAGPLFENALMAHLSSVLDNVAQHRDKNFLGSLLHHHTMQSTKFMSRWIEEKNKNPG